VDGFSVRHRFHPRARRRGIDAEPIRDLVSCFYIIIRRLMLLRREHFLQLPKPSNALDGHAERQSHNGNPLCLVHDWNLPLFISRSRRYTAWSSAFLMICTYLLRPRRKNNQPSSEVRRVDWQMESAAGHEGPKKSRP
jgi:hypothetical protein